MIQFQFQVLLRKNAAKIHKEKTDAAMAERRKVIEQRVGQPKKLEGLSDGKYDSFIVYSTFYDLMVEVIYRRQFLKLILFSISGELRALCKEYHKRICMIEDKKWDLEQEVEKKNYSVKTIFSK